MRLRKRMSASGIVITVVTLAARGGMALAAQDKYTVQVPGGLAFSESEDTKTGRLSPSVSPKASSTSSSPIPR